jgi:hypothetical protein
MAIRKKRPFRSDIINMHMFRKIAGNHEKNFHSYGNLKKIRGATGRPYYFEDNGSNVLFVAHLDSVQNYNGARIEVDPKNNNTKLYCDTLDNRLGVYLALFHFKQMGLKYDILLTLDEEKGASTAGLFSPGKEYNWMFSFDKGARNYYSKFSVNDMEHFDNPPVATYSYGDTDTHRLLRKYEFSPERGSYSDICSLKHLGCKGFNFYAGFRDYHQKGAYVNLMELSSSISKFKEFYEDNKDLRFPHAQKVNMLSPVMGLIYNTQLAVNVKRRWERFETEKNGYIKISLSNAKGLAPEFDEDDIDKAKILYRKYLATTRVAADAPLFFRKRVITKATLKAIASKYPFTVTVPRKPTGEPNYRPLAHIVAVEKAIMAKNGQTSKLEEKPKIEENLGKHLSSESIVFTGENPIKKTIVKIDSQGNKTKIHYPNFKRPDPLGKIKSIGLKPDEQSKIVQNMHKLGKGNMNFPRKKVDLIKPKSGKGIILATTGAPITKNSKMLGECTFVKHKSMNGRHMAFSWNIAKDERQFEMFDKQLAR